MNIGELTAALEYFREQLFSPRKVRCNNRIRAHRCCHI